MRILHTSDWHVGRTFHGHSTLAALDAVLTSMAELVVEKSVDVVVVAGDIYDSSTPSADAVALLNAALVRLRETNVKIVLTSGNHDSPTRLGTMADFAAVADVHILTRPERLAAPVTLGDEHGEVHFYGIPFLEPARLRHVWPGIEMRTQRDALTEAMRQINADLSERSGRSIVLAHTFVAGAEGESCDSERDITSTSVGGIDRVPVDVFSTVSYAALGHIHGRSTLADSIRYCGAPLHYSFSEGDKGRGAWLIDLDAGGLAAVEWLDLPVPRQLTTLTGTLDELLSEVSHDAVVDHWISAVLTDVSRPLDAMRKLQQRFTYCAHLEFRPSVIHDDGAASYSELVHNRTDEEIIGSFLEKVRNGEGATDSESEIIRDVLAGDNTAVNI